MDVVGVGGRVGNAVGLGRELSVGRVGVGLDLGQIVDVVIGLAGSSAVIDALYNQVGDVVLVEGVISFAIRHGEHVAIQIIRVRRRFVFRVGDANQSIELIIEVICGIVFAVRFSSNVSNVIVGLTDGVCCRIDSLDQTVIAVISKRCHMSQSICCCDLLTVVVIGEGLYRMVGCVDLFDQAIQRIVHVGRGISAPIGRGEHVTVGIVGVGGCVTACGLGECSIQRVVCGGGHMPVGISGKPHIAVLVIPR